MTDPTPKDETIVLPLCVPTFADNPDLDRRVAIAVHVLAEETDAVLKTVGHIPTLIGLAIAAQSVLLRMAPEPRAKCRARFIETMWPPEIEAVAALRDSGTTEGTA